MSTIHTSPSENHSPRSSQRLALDSSILKVSQGNLRLSGSGQSTKSAVGFKDDTAKDVKRQKQAWESPPDTPQLSRQSSQKGIEKVQDLLYPEHLEKLKEKFQDSSGNLVGEIELDEFIEFFQKFPELRRKSDRDIKTFFDKIDCYSEGKIDWDNFCTYMYLELYEKEDAKFKAKEVIFHLPATPIPGPHKDSICRICCLQDGSIVSCSQDGTICFWTHKMKQKRRRKTDTGILGKPKWISDMTLAPSHGKIILTTGDGEIQFFEMINFEPYCQISNLESTPLKVFFWSNPSNRNECILLVGDEQGTVTILCIPHIPEAFKIFKQGPRKKGMPTFLIDKLVAEDRNDVAGIKLYRWKVHSDWITDLKYFDHLRVFASSACDSTVSLLMGSPSGSTPVEAILRKAPFKRRQGFFKPTGSINTKHSLLPAKPRLPGDQKVFSISKGVASFDYCHLSNILVTGGMDQAIRLWNPFVTASPIGILYGQGSPIFNIKVDSSNERIYSISNDNTLKVWDILEQNCLGTVYMVSHKINQTVEAMIFNPVSQSVLLATDQLYSLPLVVVGGIRSANKVYTHRHSITTLNFSFAFGLVISTSSGSDVRVWNINNGECVFEFASVHGNSCITAANIDSTGRRLVTASVDGEIKIWNFNNGHCLLNLSKGNSEEVSDIKFVSVNQIKYVVAGGWDKRISVFSDTSACESVHSYISPLPLWTMSTSRVHKEDITSIALILPNLLATASFDGEIILWNIISSHIAARIKPPSLSKVSKNLSTAEGDYVIMKLLCLEKRQSRQAATIVASGPAGYVHFWNYRDYRQPAGYFKATSSMRITDMVTNSLNSTLITSDINGFVSTWNIEQFCRTLSNNNSIPECIAKWKAHNTSINSLLHIETQNIILTGSNDCSVRVWTIEGHFIGTLGQPNQWTLGVTCSYKHPMVPDDVSNDPAPKSDEEENIPVKKMEEDVTEKTTLFLDYEIGSSQPANEDDEDILLKHGLTFEVPSIDERTKSAGKRLRHLRMNSAKAASRGYEPPVGSYASLLFQDLEEEPTIDTKRRYPPSGGKSIRM